MPKSRPHRTAAIPHSAERSWLAVAGLALIVAKAVLIPAIFDGSAAQAFALPKGAVSRALLYPMLLVLVAYLALYPQRRPRGPLVWAMAAYATVAILATALAVHVSTALYGAPGRYLGLTSILDGIVLTAAVMTFVRAPRDAAWVIGGILLGAAVALAYALVQIAGIDPVEWTQGQTVSTMGNSGALAGLLVCAVAVAGAVLTLRWNALRWSGRSGLALIAGAGTLTVLSIGTRSAALAIPVAIGAITVAWWRQDSRFVRRVAKGRAQRAAVVTAALAIILGAAVAGARSPAGARLMALAQGGDLSSGERGLIYRAALDAFLARPLLGAGPDSFIAVYPSVRPPEIAAFSAGWMQSSAHSWFLHSLVGTGAIGLVTLLAIAGLALGYGTSRRVELAPTIGIVGLATFLAQGAFSINHVGTEWLFWVFVGLAGARVDTELSPASAGHSRRRQPSIAVWRDRIPTVLAMALGLAAASTALAALDASHKVLLSDRARARGDLSGAVYWAERAVMLDGGRADNWNVLGLAHMKDPERAAVAFGRAHEAAPYDPTYLLNLASAEAARSESATEWHQRALTHARRAAEADPVNYDTQQRAARLLWHLGDVDGAILRAERAVVLAPRPEDSLLLAADIYEAAGRNDEAIDRLEQLLPRRWPDGNVPLDMRRRLARLYYQTRNPEKLAAILPPPRAIQASMCGTTCIQVKFESDEDLRTDDSRGSALNLANYRVRGGALPTGTRAELRGPLTVALMMPPGTAPLTPSDVVEIGGVTDAYDRAIVPNPSVLTLR